jgi:hypothetical protein
MCFDICDYVPGCGLNDLRPSPIRGTVFSCLIFRHKKVTVYSIPGGSMVLHLMLLHPVICLD